MPHGRCAALVTVAGLIHIGLGGCGGMERIDRRADDLIAQRTATLGGDAVAPIYDHLEPSRRVGEERRASRSATEYQPSTVNPSAADLHFERADVQDEIEDLLRRYEEVIDAPVLDLPQVFHLATSRSREYVTAKEELLLAALRLLIERHRFGPRFFQEVSATFDFDAEGGDYEIAARLIHEFRVTQRLRTGGEVSARALVNATEQLRRRVIDRESQSASIILSANIPLLRGAGDVAQEALISAEREMVYATRTFERFRHEFLFAIATDYFDLIRAAAQIRNAERVLESRRHLATQTRRLVEHERRPPFELGETRQRVLASEAALAAQRDRYILQLERFRIRLGLPPDHPILIDEMRLLDLPVPALDAVEAVRRALAYRLDIQNTRDRLDDARRAVANARNDLLPDLNLSASMTIITDPELQRGGLQFDPDEIDYRAAITFGLPWDREIERLGLRQRTIAYERSVRGLRLAEDNIRLSVRAVIRDIQLALYSLQIQNENIRVTLRRIEGLELRREDVAPRTMIEAQDDLAAALDQREAAVRDVRVAILRYLLETGQLRVDVNGQLLPPPGMEPLLPEEAQELYERGIDPDDGDLNPWGRPDRPRTMQN